MVFNPQYSLNTLWHHRLYLKTGDDETLIIVVVVVEDVVVVVASFSYPRSGYQA